MEKTIERAVRRAILTMRDNLGEQLTVDDMARAAMFSKFHFTRVFQRSTGVSPGRFLSALRLERAKHLLTSTSLNVADISLRVGYNSVGTFSARFRRSVGMSPTTYRRCAGYAAQIDPDPAYGAGEISAARIHGQIRGQLSGARRMVFAGLFPEPVPEGRPACCTVLSPGVGSYAFSHVPVGRWYLLAQCGVDPDDPTADPDSAISVATHGPFTVTAVSDLTIDLWLKPVDDLDPPVLLALLDARREAITRVAETGYRAA